MLAAGSSVPGLVNASQHPWAGSAASTAEPPVGWEQLKGRKSRELSASPFLWVPTHLGVPCLLASLWSWDPSWACGTSWGREEEVKFSPMSFSPSHVPWPLQLVAQWPE